MTPYLAHGLLCNSTGKGVAKMKRIIRTILFSAVSGVVLVSFQNCAKVKNLESEAGDRLVSGDSSGGTGGTGSGPTGGVLGGSNPASGGGETPRQKAERECEEAKAVAANVSESIDIMNFSGNRIVRVQNLGVISNYNGNLIVIGAGDVNTTRLLKDSNGTYLFCHMDLMGISNFKAGNVTLVGGNIGSIDGFIGNINVFGGQVTGTVVNVTGNIDEYP